MAKAVGNDFRLLAKLFEIPCQIGIIRKPHIISLQPTQLGAEIKMLYEIFGLENFNFISYITQLTYKYIMLDPHTFT